MAINPAEEGKFFAAEAKARKSVEKWRKIGNYDNCEVLEKSFLDYSSENLDISIKETRRLTEWRYEDKFSIPPLSDDGRSSIYEIGSVDS